MKRTIFLLFLIGILISCDKNNPNPEEEYANHTLPLKNKVVHKIAFSSGCKQDRPQNFWKNISAKNPDLWIWGGDNIYSDTEDRNVLKYNYNKLKQNKYYQEFIKEIPVIGVWDDHDYGARDSGEEYILKEESKEEFLDFFDIPDTSSIRNHKGIYTSYELGNDEKSIKIYLLDNRTFKTELTLDTEHENYYLPDSTGTILGENQWLWLANEIEKSNSKINIFVSGLQIISDEHIYEKWGNFPKERQRFLDLLESTNVKNPIILSGDRHFAEFSKYVFTDNSSVLEFTASGMTHSFEGVVEENIYRVGELYDGKNFGFLNIDWNQDNTATINLTIFDIDGTEKSNISIEIN